jgi:hypothetical protein
LNESTNPPKRVDTNKQLEDGWMNLPKIIDAYYFTPIGWIMDG